MIKAIETHYNGYMFRSRLEARWAVFFDAAKIKYQYEPEGFEVDGVKYLPDFYLPQFDTYVEVKPDTPDGRKEIVEKVRKFVVWGGKIKRILILSDIPRELNDGGLWHFPCVYWFDNIPNFGWMFFAEGDYVYLSNVVSIPYKSWVRYKYGDGFDYEQMSIAAKSDYSLDLLDTPVMRELFKHRLDPSEETKNGWCSNRVHNKAVFDAIAKARQARFEFGERG